MIIRERPRHIYYAHVTRVVDSDTLELDVDLGFNVHTHILVHLEGIKPPRMVGPNRIAGKQAVDVIKAWVFSNLEQVIVSTTETTEDGWNAQVWSNSNGESLNEHMRSRGY